MKRGKKMLVIIISVLGVIGLISWGIIAYLGGSRTLEIKAVESINGDLYFIRLKKPESITWKAGSYANISIAESGKKAVDAVSGATDGDGDKKEKSRWLTIASNPEENEILILTHNSGSIYKETLIGLPAGSKVKMSWLGAGLSPSDDKKVMVCFASDVGIAAIRPIIKEWAYTREIYFTHLDKGVKAFNGEISELTKSATSLTYETSDSISKSKEQLKNAINKYGNAAIYLLSGQPDDVGDIKKFLAENGIDSKNIKTDSFRGLQQ